MLLAVLWLTGGCTEDDETTQGQWIKKVSYNGYARAYACSFTIDNKGYMFGGYRGANKEYLNDLWEYDMDANVWTQCESMPTVGRRYAAAFALNGKGYVTTGGIKDGSTVTYVADTWEYDPASNTWTQKDDYKGGAREGALAFSIGGYGYVGTGYNDDTIGWMLDFYRFNPNAAAGMHWELVNGFGGARFERIQDEFDEKLLRSLAEITGGSYFHAADADGMKQVMDQINQLEKTTIEQPKYIEFREYAPRLALVALGLLLLGFIADTTWCMRLP